MTVVSQPAYSMGKDKSDVSSFFFFDRRLPKSLQKSERLVSSLGALKMGKVNTAYSWKRALVDEVDSIG